MQLLDDLFYQFPPVVMGPGFRRGDDEMDYLVAARGGVFCSSTAIAEISGFMK